MTVTKVFMFSLWVEGEGFASMTSPKGCNKNLKEAQTMEFYKLNQQKYQEQLQLRYNLMMINRIANISTVAILAVVGLITVLRVF